MPPRLRGVTADAVTASARRAFSSTPRQERITKNRFEMYTWLNGTADRMLESGRRGPSYLGPFTDQPFPANPLFRSQPVLSDETREIIYRKVMGEGNALKSVSEEMGVDIRRIAAVIRMKQVEKDWVKKGKKLATPYAKAVMDMLPQTRFTEGETNPPHEPINDIPVHKLSVQQLFVPVSESRHFTREDAAKAFHETLLSADSRSPHGELIKMERKVATTDKSREEGLAEFREEAQKQEERFARKLADQMRLEQRAIRKNKTERFEFRIKQIDSGDVGRDGRSRNGVGWRYGAPLQDRKRGMVKIPTSVP